MDVVVQLRTIQTVDTIQLLESWRLINATIAAGMRSKLGALKSEHLALFPESERRVASKVFDDAVTDVSADVAGRRALRADRTLTMLAQQAAADQRAKE